MVSYGNKYPRHNARPHVVEQSGQCARALRVLTLSQASKKISGSQATEGISRKVSVLIGDLKPGDKYVFDIYTTANGLNSDMLRLATRTSKFLFFFLFFFGGRVSK